MRLGLVGRCIASGWFNRLTARDEIERQEAEKERVFCLVLCLGLNSEIFALLSLKELL